MDRPRHSRRKRPQDLGPVEITDCDGKAHVAHFSTRSFGLGIALDACELRDGVAAGYQFQVIGESDDDPLMLRARLIEKARRALSVRHTERGTYGLRIVDFAVRGRIEWGPHADDH